MAVLPALSARANELSDLHAQIQAMHRASLAVEKRLARLEREKAASSSSSKEASVQVAPPIASAFNGPRPSLVTSRFPGYIDIPGTDTSVKIGGFVKIDGVYDVHGGGIGGTATDFPEIFLKGTPGAKRGGDFNATARQTQIQLSSITPTSAFGDVKTYAAFDFYGANNGNGVLTNSYSPRVYTLYASADHVLGGSLMVGQNWSTFMDLDSYPETIDFNGPVGVSFIRQPQVRYTRDLGAGSKMYFSAEAAYADFEGANPYPVYTAGGAPSTNVINPIPDFVAKYTYDAAWGHLAVSGLARYIKDDTGGAMINNFSGQSGVLGVGGLAGLVVKTGGLDTFNLQAVGGRGIGRYLYGDDDSGGSAASLAGCKNTLLACGLRATTSYGGTASYQHYWTEKLRSNLVAGVAHYVDEFPDDPSVAVNTLYSAFVDLIYTPIPKTDIGVELIYGKKVVDASPGPGISNKGDAFRLLVSVKTGF